MKKFEVLFVNKHDETSVTVDNLVSLNFSCLDRGSFDDITNWGIYCNRGDCTFAVSNDTALWFEQSVSLVAQIFYVTDVDRKKLATFKVNNIQINYETKEISCEFEDVLLRRQNTMHDRVVYMSKKSLYSMLSELCSDGNIDKNLLQYPQKLGEVKVRCADIPKENYYATIDTILNAAMTRGFSDENGRLAICTDLSEIEESASPIIIEPKDILSVLEHSPKEKNRLPNITRSLPITIPYVDQETDIRLTANLWKSSIASPLNFSGTGDIPVSYPYEGTSSGKVISCDFTKNINSQDLVNANSVKYNYTYHLANEEYTPPNTPRLDLKKLRVNQNAHTLDIAFDIYRTIQETYGYYVSDFTVVIVGDFYREEAVQTQIHTSPDIDAETLDISSNYLAQGNDKNVSGAEESTGQDELFEMFRDKYTMGVECVVMETLMSSFKAKGETNERYIINRYDIVCPYIMRNGWKQPYSTNEDGYPKTFRVIGKEYAYSGMLRQRLYLQEAGFTVPDDIHAWYVRIWFSHSENSDYKTYSTRYNMPWKNWIFSSYNKARITSYQGENDNTPYVVCYRFGLRYYLTKKKDGGGEKVYVTEYADGDYYMVADY